MKNMNDECIVTLRNILLISWTMILISYFLVLLFIDTSEIEMIISICIGIVFYIAIIAIFKTMDYVENNIEGTWVD